MALEIQAHQAGCELNAALHRHLWEINYQRVVQECRNHVLGMEIELETMLMIKEILEGKITARRHFKDLREAEADKFALEQKALGVIQAQQNWDNAIDETRTYKLHRRIEALEEMATSIVRVRGTLAEEWALLKRMWTRGAGLEHTLHMQRRSREDTQEVSIGDAIHNFTIQILTRFSLLNRKPTGRAPVLLSMLPAARYKESRRY